MVFQKTCDGIKSEHFTNVQNKLSIESASLTVSILHQNNERKILDLHLFFSIIIIQLNVAFMLQESINQNMGRGIIYFKLHVIVIYAHFQDINIGYLSIDTGKLLKSIVLFHGQFSLGIKHSGPISSLLRVGIGR